MLFLQLQLMSNVFPTHRTRNKSVCEIPSDVLSFAQLQVRKHVRHNRATQFTLACEGYVIFFQNFNHFNSNYCFKTRCSGRRVSCSKTLSCLMRPIVLHFKTLLRHLGRQFSFLSSASPNSPWNLSYSNCATWIKCSMIPMCIFHSQLMLQNYSNIPNKKNNKNKLK